MKTEKVLLIWLILSVTLIEVNYTLESDLKVSKKPPDIESVAKDENITKNEKVNEKDSSNKTEGSKQIRNLDDEDELLGQETIQSKISELNDLTTDPPSTSTENPSFRSYVRPTLPYYPARYLFRLKPSIKKNSRLSLKTKNASVVTTSKNNTVSEAMLKWRSRYNYIFRRRGSTTKPSYLKKYLTNYLIGSESSTYSSKTRGKPKYRFNGRNNKIRSYSYRSRTSRKNNSNGRYKSRSNRSRSRSRSRSSSRRSRVGGLSTSGSYRSYQTRRFFPPAQSSNSNVAVPGKPEVDYPTYIRVPKTSFSCDNRVGSFPDYEARCQLWHMCYGGGLHSSFLCPNGTLFNPKVSVCDWWYMVSCE